MQQERSDDGRQCGNAWSGLEDQSKKTGSARESGEEEVQSEIFTYEEEQGLPKELHEGGSQEAVTSGHGASYNVESAYSGDGSHKKDSN